MLLASNWNGDVRGQTGALDLAFLLCIHQQDATSSFAIPSHTPHPTPTPRWATTLIPAVPLEDTYDFSYIWVGRGSSQDLEAVPPHDSGENQPRHDGFPAPSQESVLSSQEGGESSAAAAKWKNWLGH